MSMRFRGCRRETVGSFQYFPQKNVEHAATTIDYNYGTGV